MLPENSTTNKRVILIHGMWMNTFSLRFIGNQLTKKGWVVIYYDYSSMFSSFEQNVDGLYTLWQQNNSSGVHLVGHSLGGLLVLAMMEKYQLTNLPRTVLMGCPVNGSAVVEKMLPSRIGKAMLGKSAQALLSGANHSLSNAQSNSKPDSRPETLPNKVGIIIGSRGIGIGHMIRKLPKPHDGVVAADEADMEGVEDKIILPVTHATMLISRKVSNAVDRYLSAGHFEV